MPEDFLPVHAFAKKYHVDPTTVYRGVHEGRVPWLKLGRRLLIPLGQVNSLIVPCRPDVPVIKVNTSKKPAKPKPARKDAA